jgi:hypothetical protein
MPSDRALRCFLSRTTGDRIRRLRWFTQSARGHRLRASNQGASAFAAQNYSGFGLHSFSGDGGRSGCVVDIFAAQSSACGPTRLLA